MQRVTRPRGGINKWLHWLPVSLHRKVDYVIRQICIYSGVQVEARWSKVVPFTGEKTGMCFQLSNYMVSYYSTKNGTLLC